MPLIYLNPYKVSGPPAGYLYIWGPATTAYGDNESLPVSRSSPVQLGSELWRFTDGSSVTTVAVKKNGTLWAWGYNANGEVGDGTTITRSSPVQVGTDSDWASTADFDKPLSSFGHTLALKKDGTLWAWGLGTSGQLGLGDAQSRSSPVQVGSDTWKFVSVGTAYSHGIKTDGTLWAWGYNSSPGNGSLLGDGSNTARSSPIQIGASTWSWITQFRYSASTGTTLAVNADGSLWAWGENPTQLFGFTNPRSSIPLMVPGSTGDWKMVSLGSDGAHAVGIQVDGTMWSWSNNSGIHSGILGLNDTVDRSSPTQIGSGTDWAWVDVGYDQNVAYKTDGTLWVWGHNTSNALGSLGQNDQIWRSSPVQVGSGTDWIAAEMEGVCRAIRLT